MFAQRVQLWSRVTVSFCVLASLFGCPPPQATTPPTITSFALNNGAASTATLVVTLNNTCTGSPTHYMASESSGLAGATWKAYGTAPSFTLSSGVGAKTVYFIVKNAAGQSLPKSDTITLDSSSPGTPRVFGDARYDAASSVQQTSDGGYILAGNTQFVDGSYDMYLVKADVSGNFVWQKTFGGTGNDAASSMHQTSDGGYVLAGSILSAGSKMCLIKTNASGNQVWQKTFGSSATAFSMQQTNDGGYILAGDTWTGGNEAMYLVKTNSSGNLVWQKTFGSSAAALSMHQTNDGGYIVAGYILPVGTAGDLGDMYLVKTDASGNLVWEKTFGGATTEYAHSVQQTSDGGYILAGATWAGGNEGMYLVKTDASGNLVWQKNFGGAGNETASSVQQTSDGGYILAGSTTSLGGGGDMYLVKTDVSGNLVWQENFGGTGNDGASSVQQTSDGGYVLAGNTNSFGAGGQDMYLVKTDASGNQEW